MAAGPVGTTWAVGSWSDLAWEALTWADASAINVDATDLNTMLLQYLQQLYAVTNTDLTTLITRYLQAYDGDKSNGFKALVAAATAA